MRHALVRALLRIGGVGVGVALTGLLIVNVAVNLALPTLLNGKPDRLHVDYTWAWMVIPGKLHVRGLEISGRGRADQWALSARHASGSIDLGSLRHRTFRVDPLLGSGVSFRYSLREPSETFERDPRGPWTVDLPDLVFHHVDELSIEGHRLATNGGNATGSLRMGEAVSFDAKLEIAGGKLYVAGRPAADTVAGLLTASATDLERFAPLQQASLGQLSAAAKLTAVAADLGFLDRYLERSPWLTVNGPAHLVVDAALDQGALRSGSQVLARSDALRVGFRSYRLEGHGLVWFGVDTSDPDARTRIALQLDDYSILEDGRTEALAVGGGFQVLVTSPDVAIDRPLTGLRVVIDLPESEIQSITHLDDLLPNKVGIGVVGGRGRIRGHLQAGAGGESSATGDLYVEGRDLVVTWDALRIETDASVHARLRQGDLVAGQFDFAGSRVALNRLRTHDPERPEDTLARDWWAEVDVPRGMVQVAAATALDADLVFRCADSGPFVDLVAQRKALAGWVQGLLSRPDVVGTGRLVLAEESFAIRRLAIEAGRSAELQLDLHRIRRKSTGAMFAKLGPMSLGLSFDDQERRFHLLNARKWYDGQIAR